MEKLDLLKQSYNELPYVSKGFSHTLPERQRAVLSLLGFHTPHIEHAKVLEIGCGFGGNIISSALIHPNAHFVGVDLSETQIEGGKAIVNQLGLKNVELLCQDISFFENSSIKFDYIVCHGVFSWVPESVRRKILTVIKSHLSENGAATISYNTYPGWKSLEALKDMMTFRVDLLAKQNIHLSMREKVAYGKGTADFLSQFALGDKRMKDVADGIKDKDEHYIYHEYFEEYNQPLYLYEFNELLEEYGLAHICDSSVSATFPIFKDDRIETLLDNECGDNHLLKEQYYDYILNRQFRTSIVTHLENREKCNISRHIQINDLKNIYIRTNLNAESSSKVVQSLKAHYPNAMKVSNFVERYFTDNRNDGYTSVLLEIYNENIDFYARNITVTKQDKIKLKTVYRKYLDYYLNTEKPVISLSNFVGNTLVLNSGDIHAILSFDGQHSDEELADLLFEKVQAGILRMNHAHTEQEQKATLLAFIKDTRAFVEANLMNE
ncbi:methyltransferase regulatory domain-containing protein [Pasteurella multocida]|uniref:methyltransferase regulatory domain-containing protein n=1 Tax=Pasteurella multocida TaxID=747 RepID=UPI0028DD5E34|nr:methyltransferase regulatory domain-containing protein [Pasteurella multocida]HDR1154273.1 methyltransferase regulatory domain-containing protein [Pasteurella multocida]HDR1164960.1 methyltransferase regulatory domain-containing protein [Pasteurella multocida]HDR1508713.1 methyltransferase regulatory domain-containing protein [Pasteurella multocida]HEA3315562.1 methyltransferase regulatory domain-containing protein [Pasteurella multocida]